MGFENSLFEYLKRLKFLNDFIKINRKLIKDSR